MTPERYRQIDELLEQALELEPERREAFLDQACGNDDELRHTLASLLKAGQQSGGLLDAPAFDVAAREMEEEQERTPPPSLIGREIGHFRILALLGAGGMGEVYRARDTRLDRAVAIKVLPAHLARDSEALARFQREARAVAALSHPNILAIHDFGTDQGISYAVTELLEGETLRARLRRSPLPWRRAVEIGIGVADGLSAAHAKGIIHRDLKPENIFLTTDRQVKILDFGLARIKHVVPGPEINLTTTRPLLTRPGVVMGTVGYMSPEQVRGEVADAPSDLFSLGCVFYEMLSGRRAFARPGPVETMAAILQDQPPKLAEAGVGLPAELDLIVSHCLEKKVEARFHSAHDLSFALRALLGESKTLHIPAPRSVQRIAPAVLVLIAVVMLATLILAVRSFRRPPTDGSPIRFAVPLPGAWIGTEMENIFMAVSPDGQHLAFVVENEGRRALWVRPRDSVSARLLAGTEEASSPFWSPDSRWIGFFAEGRLKKIEVSGGPPQVLCNVRIGVGTGTWGRDGTILFGGQGGKGEGIYRVSDYGGTPAAVIKSDQSHAWYFWPHFLPDGKNFLFLKSDSHYKGASIHLGSLDGGESRALLQASSRVEYVAPGYLLYVQEGTLVARPFDAESLRLTGEQVPIAEQVQYFNPTGYADFSVSESLIVYRAGEIASRLVWFDRNGREMGTAGAPGRYEEPRLSPDGKKIAVGLVDPGMGTLDIWTLEPGRDISTRITTTRQTTEFGPVWSPDGLNLAFAADPTGPPRLHRKMSSGAGEVEDLLLTESQVQYADDWSADGQFIIYTEADARTKLDILVLPLFGDRKPLPILKTPFNEKEARFSPDGRWIAYVSDESGKNEVYVQPFQTSGQSSGERWTISTAGGSQPVWRRDGKELFYLASDNKLMAVPIKTSARFEVGSPATLFKTEPAAEHAYDVTDDGQRFLINTNVTTAKALPVMAVINWSASLRR
jgi:Tol biopolymer transport system component